MDWLHHHSSWCAPQHVVVLVEGILGCLVNLSPIRCLSKTVLHTTVHEWPRSIFLLIWKLSSALLPFTSTVTARGVNHEWWMYNLHSFLIILLLILQLEPNYILNGVYFRNIWLRMEICLGKLKFELTWREKELKIQKSVPGSSYNPRM